jgi:hypothetical protein
MNLEYLEIITYAVAYVAVGLSYFDCLQAII